jgi:hypothetical protein
VLSVVPFAVDGILHGYLHLWNNTNLHPDLIDLLGTNFMNTATQKADNEIDLAEAT